MLLFFGMRTDVYRKDSARRTSPLEAQTVPLVLRCWRCRAAEEPVYQGGDCTGVLCHTFCAKCLCAIYSVFLRICTGIPWAVPLLTCTMPKDLVNDTQFRWKSQKRSSGLPSFVVFLWHSMGRRQELMCQESPPGNNSNRPLFLMSTLSQRCVICSLILKK